MSDVLHHPMIWPIVRARDVSYCDLGIAETLESFPWRYLTEEGDDHALPQEDEFAIEFARISEACGVPVELVKA